MSKRDFAITKIHVNAKVRLDKLKRNVSLNQNKDISMKELSRRMERAESMNLLERELIEDAKAKRRLGR